MRCVHIVESRSSELFLGALTATISTTDTWGNPCVKTVFSCYTCSVFDSEPFRWYSSGFIQVETRLGPVIKLVICRQSLCL